MIDFYLFKKLNFLLLISDTFRYPILGAFNTIF